MVLSLVYLPPYLGGRLLRLEDTEMITLEQGKLMSYVEALPYGVAEYGQNIGLSDTRCSYEPLLSELKAYKF